MKKAAQTLVLRNDDHEILTSYLSSQELSGNHSIEALQAELKKAKLVSKEEFPEDAIRLNSRVTVKDANNGKEMELMVVMPDDADIKQRKISVTAPVGIALIGFRKGQKVGWQVPAGMKTFTITDVVNQD
jgi:regulator of nucleoside diphosphate kinase